jgi:mono/diheme cytochrome c family protein
MYHPKTSDDLESEIEAMFDLSLCPIIVGIFTLEQTDHNNQEFAKPMTSSSGKLIERILLLFNVFLAGLLVGCGPASQPEVAEPVAAEVIAAGNVDHGRDLFMGYAHFENDGPPCMGCHSVGNNGILGGGAMGPDLTNVSSERSQTEILAVLSNTGRKISPVMRPIYIDHPLTWAEQVDLLAFLDASVGQTESDKELLVIGISVAGFVAATAVLGFVYRGRLRGVRRALVQKGTVARS